MQSVGFDVFLNARPVGEVVPSVTIGLRRPWTPFAGPSAEPLTRRKFNEYKKKMA